MIKKTRISTSVEKSFKVKKNSNLKNGDILEKAFQFYFSSNKENNSVLNLINQKKKEQEYFNKSLQSMEKYIKRYIKMNEEIIQKYQEVYGTKKI